MRKKYNLKCSCGAIANFSVDFSTFNQERVNNLLRQLEIDARHWMELHEKCTSKHRSTYLYK
jgi:hypothetical protein